MTWSRVNAGGGWVLGAAVVATLALVGCEGVTIYEPLQTQRYANGMFEHASRNGQMKTEVFGNPFGTTPNFAQTVADYMYGATRSPPVKFETQPQGPSSAPFHVVMAFDPPRSATSDDACAQRIQTTAPNGSGSVRLFAAFCSGDVVMSEAEGRAGGITGPADPKFRSLVRQVATALIPPYDRRGVGVGGGGGNTP